MFVKLLKTSLNSFCVLGVGEKEEEKEEAQEGKGW